MQQAHTLARTDGMPKGLKIKNKTGLVSCDASKTKRVDYVQEIDEDDTESTQSETESDTELDNDNSDSSESSNETS